MFQYYANHNKDLKRRLWALKLFKFLYLGFGYNKQSAHAVSLYLGLGRLQFMFDLSLFNKETKSDLWINSEQSGDS